MSDRWTLFEKITSAQKGNQKSLEQLIEQFQPLIKKYAAKSGVEDGYNELILTFIEMIHKIPLAGFAEEKREYLILGYIKKSIKSRSTALLKQHIEEKARLVSLDEIIGNPMPAYQVGHLDFYVLLSGLTVLQKKVILLIYRYGLSSAETAKRLGISRQAVNQCKRRAIKFLRRELNARSAEVRHR